MICIFNNKNLQKFLAMWHRKVCHSTGLYTILWFTPNLIWSTTCCPQKIHHHLLMLHLGRDIHFFTCVTGIFHVRSIHLKLHTTLFWHHNEKYVASHKKILRKQTISHELNLWSLQSINYCINIILVTSFYCTLPYFFLLSLKLTPYFWFFSLKKVKTTQDKYILHVRLYINDKT